MFPPNPMYETNAIQLHFKFGCFDIYHSGLARSALFFVTVYIVKISTVLSWIKKTECLILHCIALEIQKEEIWRTTMSAHCPKILPNVVRGQISDFFRYVLSKL